MPAGPIVWAAPTPRNGTTISDLVNDAVRSSLSEDADDLAAVEARRSEPSRSFAAFVSDLRRRGKLVAHRSDVYR